MLSISLPIRKPHRYTHRQALSGAQCLSLSLWFYHDLSILVCPLAVEYEEKPKGTRSEKEEANVADNVVVFFLSCLVWFVWLYLGGGDGGALVVHGQSIIFMKRRIQDESAWKRVRHPPSCA